MRAIKTKIGEVRENGKSNLSVEDEKELLNLIHTKYSRASMVYKTTDSDLHSLALHQLNLFFESKNELEIWQYF